MPACTGTPVPHKKLTAASVVGSKVRREALLTDRETETETDRQRDRARDRDRDRQMDREIDRQTDKHRDIWIDRQTDTQRQIRQADRTIERQGMTDRRAAETTLNRCIPN